ncbi:MAG: carbamate kinase [Acidimicrobiia bacterium]
MLVVVALGGNALLRPGDPRTVDRQRANVRVAAGALAPVLRDHDVVLTHGNGPQVGELARVAAAAGESAPPLDVLDAETEGLVGYLLAQELRNAVPERELVTLLTQVVVDAADPAFARPDKPIGAWYDESAARAVAHDYGWTMTENAGRWRRVVPSPLPQSIVELRAVRTVLAAGIVPIAVGGGGIPVVVAPDGRTRGVDAVVDKDRTAALLAQELGADRLALLTDVDGVYLGWGTGEAQRIALAHPDALAAHGFAAGSMGPKVEAAVAFARGGGTAVIGALDDAARVVTGATGTGDSAGTTVTTAAPGITIVR